MKWYGEQHTEEEDRLKMLFDYNWQVRDEWFNWCRQLSHEELVKERAGGMKSFLATLLHIIDVEYSWIRAMEGKEDMPFSMNEYSGLEEAETLSGQWRQEAAAFLAEWTDETAEETVRADWHDRYETKGEILRHIAVHEIHHIGQMSVWARELGLQPPSAGLLGRGLSGRK